MDLQGFESSTSSVRWINIWGNKGKLPSIASTTDQKYHTTRYSPCMVFEHIYTQIVHTEYSSMEQVKAIRRPVQVGDLAEYIPNLFCIKNYLLNSMPTCHSLVIVCYKLETKQSNSSNNQPV